MPPVLVDEALVRPRLDGNSSNLDKRLSGSRGIFDRVRALSSSGAVSVDELSVVEEVLLRSDVGVSTTNVIVESLRTNGAPDGVASAVRQELLDALGEKDRSLRVDCDEGRIPVWLFV